MSAILSQPPRPKVRELPPELLFHIFRLATEVPSYLNPDVIVGPSIVRDREQLDLSSHALVTKRYLVRACKQFYKIATPLLYEHLIVARAKALPKIHTTLEASESSVSEEGNSRNRPLGSWTKRIDFVVRDRFYGPSLQSDFLKYLGLILQRLPNLKVFIICNTDKERLMKNLPHDFLESMPFKQSLEVMKIFSGDGLPMTWYPNLSQSFTNLKALAELCPNFNRPTEDKLSLPSLESLSAYALSPLDLNSELPNLRRLIMPILSHLNPVGSPSIGSTLFNTHGHQFTHVQVIWSIECPIRFRGLERTCPNMTRLDVTLSSWTYIPHSGNGESGTNGDEFCLPSSVVTFGFECLAKQAASTCYRQMINLVNRMVVGDNFKEIVLMEAGNILDFRDRHTNIWRSFIQTIKGRNFKLLGPDGEHLC